MALRVRGAARRAHACTALQPYGGAQPLMHEATEAHALPLTSHTGLNAAHGLMLAAQLLNKFVGAQTAEAGRLWRRRPIIHVRRCRPRLAWRALLCWGAATCGTVALGEMHELFV